MKIAEVGNVVEFKDGLQGIVEKVNENSVIVDITITETMLLVPSKSVTAICEIIK